MLEAGDLINHEGYMTRLYSQLLGKPNKRYVGEVARLK